MDVYNTGWEFKWCPYLTGSLQASSKIPLKLVHSIGNFHFRQTFIKVREITCIKVLSLGTCRIIIDSKPKPAYVRAERHLKAINKIKDRCKLCQEHMLSSDYFIIRTRYSWKSKTKSNIKQWSYDQDDERKTKGIEEKVRKLSRA